jgi:DegV family protein with EDD domain
MKTAIVTDSTADVPPALAEQLGIHVIPAILVIEGQSYEDGQGLTREQFYERLPDMQLLPSTGTPSAGTFENLYRQLFGQGIEFIISIHVASLLSGICNTAQLAAQTFGERVRVIDSQSLSLGIGFQVLAAAEAAAQNLPLDKIFAQIESTRQRMHLCAMLDTLEYIHRSGRVGWARARIGSLLRIKPFVEVKDGQVFNLGQARTRRNGIARLRELLQELGELERLAILHTNAAEEARNFLEIIDWPIPANPLIINVTTVIGTHVGPNGLGFAAVSQ